MGRYIVPLDLGESAYDRSLFFLRKFIGQRAVSKTVAAYIGGAKKKIVVDAGPPDMERSLKYHPYFKSEPRTPEQFMPGALAKAGVKPEEVELVILTHLHWDHVGAVELFPNAQFIVSEEELRFALNPTPCLYASYEALQLGIQPLFLKILNRLKTVDMKEKEILPGVRTIPLPGHSPGGIGVVVETDEGPYVIAGDAVPTWENLRGDPKNGQRYYMSGVYTDMQAMWKSFELIDEIVQGDVEKVIAGHESLVFNKARYPDTTAVPGGGPAQAAAGK
jgi:glyoxylase-like metal-dependent hydrolase (beta-lactamase superfamily II)